MHDAYGIELIMDLHNCNPAVFNRRDLQTFVQKLCDLIDMEREDLYFWDYDDEEAYNEAPAHLKGTSLVQFIRTSNIVIHTLDELKKVFINVFSCKNFDIEEAKKYVVEFFEGNIAQVNVMRRI